MQAPVTPSSQSRTNHESRGLPKYNEIHVDHEISVTTSESRSRVAQARPRYSLTPIIYSPSGSSQSEYSQSSHDHESPATSVERSSDPISEGTIANLDTMLISRNTSSATRPHSARADTITDRVAHRELVDFLRTCEPPSNNLMSVPESREEIVKRKSSFRLFAKKSAPRKRTMKLPNSAVAATTTSGRKHIAISIRDEHDRPESQYQYHAPVKAPEPQTRAPQKLQKSPPRAAGSAKTNSPKAPGSAKTGTVMVKKPVVEPSSSQAQTRNGSVRVNVEQGPWSFEAPTAAQHNSLAARSRSDLNLNAPEVIGTDNAVLLQRFWEQHPPPENRHELSGSNRNIPLKVSQTVQLSPGRQGSEMTDPRHSGGTAYSERTLAATASAGHSRESSGHSNSIKQPYGARLVTIGNHPVRTSSRSKGSTAAPATPRSFSLAHSKSTSGSARRTASEAGPSKTSPLRLVVPAEIHNGDNDLISLSGFLVGSPSYGRPQQPGPAPNRKLPDLPEGSDVSRNGSSSSNDVAALRAESSIPRVVPSSSKASSKAATEKAPFKNETETDYPDHPANRSVSNREDAELVGPTRNARQERQDRVRAKKQRDIALAKENSAISSQSGSLRTREESQHQATTSLPTIASRTGTVRGSVRAARKRTENLLPAPLGFGPFPVTENEDRPQTSRSLPATITHTTNKNGSSLSASSFGSGKGKGSVRHARKRSENLMSSLAKVEASPITSSKLENPSLRAAANALSTIMVTGEGKQSHLNNFPYLPPPIPGQGDSSRVNEFSLPPRSAKRQSPHTFVTGNLNPGGFSATGAQTPPRSPSPSLQSSDEEGNLNDGRNVTGQSLKSPLRSRSQGNSTSTKPIVVTSRAKTISIHPSQHSHQKVATITPSHSQSGSGNSNTISHKTHPPLSHSSRPKQSLNSKHQSTTASLTAAINAFELHRANRRKERNRLIRDRRARELAISKERAAHDETVDKRLTKGEETHSVIEDRMKRIEDRGVDMAKKYDLIMTIARDLEVMINKVQRLEEDRSTTHNNDTTSSQSRSQAPSSRGRESSIQSPEVGKLGSRGMRIDISMPPSTTGESPATAYHDPVPEIPRHTHTSSLPHSTRRQRTAFNNRDLDFSGEESEALPQYSGHGISDLLGGGGGFNFGIDRSGTPIGSMIEELEVQGSSKSSSVAGVVGRSGDDGGTRSIKRISLPKVRRGARDGSVRYGSQGRGYGGGSGGSGWEVSSVGTALPTDVERGLVVSDLSSA